MQNRKALFKKLVGIMVFCGCLSTAYGQQQAMYTQYMFNTLAINPAYASVDESLTITALARQQWVGFKGAPKTQTISVHTPVKESNTFVGALLINDQVGQVLKETGGYFTLSQRVAIGEYSFLSAGINAGASSFRSTFTELHPYSPESVNDQVFANTSSIRANFGFGVMFFSDKYYVGLSSPAFYQRDFTSYGNNETINTKPHYFLQAGVLLGADYDVKFKPSILLKYVNGSPLQADINANVLFNEKLWLGLSYRSADSFGAMASFFITPDVQVGYSYDFINTALAKAQSGSHEIMLKFRLPVKGRDHLACYF